MYHTRNQTIHIQPGVAYPKEIAAPLPEVDPLVPPEGSEDE